ncbi:MAG: hypothetical protein ACJ77A_07720 [Actinomycetota bacterium]
MAAILGTSALVATFVALNASREPGTRVPRSRAAQVSGPGHSEGAASGSGSNEGISISKAFGDDPFADGKSATLSDAQKELSFALPQPNGILASPQLLSQVWLDKEGKQAALWYADTEVLVLVSSMDGGSLDVSALAAELKEQGAWVASVNDIPALLIPQMTSGANGEGTQDNPGSVTFMSGPVSVQVLGYLSSDDLLSVATSISTK